MLLQTFTVQPRPCKRSLVTALHSTPMYTNKIVEWLINIPHPLFPESVSNGGRGIGVLRMWFLLWEYVISISLLTLSWFGFDFLASALSIPLKWEKNTHLHQLEFQVAALMMQQVAWQIVVSLAFSTVSGAVFICCFSAFFFNGLSLLAKLILEPIAPCV